MRQLLDGLGDPVLGLGFDLRGGQRENPLVDADRLVGQLLLLLDLADLQKRPVDERRFGIETVEELAGLDRLVEVVGDDVQLPLRAEGLLGKGAGNDPRLPDDRVDPREPLAHLLDGALHQAHRLEDPTELKEGRALDEALLRGDDRIADLILHGPRLAVDLAGHRRGGGHRAGRRAPDVEFVDERGHDLVPNRGREGGVGAVDRLVLHERHEWKLAAEPPGVHIVARGRGRGGGTCGRLGGERLQFSQRDCDLVPRPPLLLFAAEHLLDVDAGADGAADLVGLLLLESREHADRRRVGLRGDVEIGFGEQYEDRLPEKRRHRLRLEVAPREEE